MFDSVSFDDTCTIGHFLPDPGMEPSYPALQVDYLPLSHRENQMYNSAFMIRKDGASNMNNKYMITFY